MRIRLCWACFLLGTTMLLGLATQPARGQVMFSAGIEIRTINDFAEPLAPYGVWVDLPQYGRCWHPYVEHGWEPYTNGHWEWTDCGWYFASDDPWAWAGYHYGSWVHDWNYGWLWIPGTEWAPAWVNWRQGPDYIGWAPCGPRGVVLDPQYFCFVDVHHFREPLRPSFLVFNNPTIIQRTRVINNIRRETRAFDGTRARVVINTGPGVQPIERVTGSRFTA